MTETTAMIVRTPMMMPSRVRKVRSLLARSETQAIVNDSPACKLAMAILYLFYHEYEDRPAWFTGALPSRNGSCLVASPSGLLPGAKRRPRCTAERLGAVHLVNIQKEGD